MGAIAFSERRKVEELIKEQKHNSGEVASCQTKLLNEVRNMVGLGLLKFEKIDPDLVIPENIEEVLNSGGSAAFINAAFETTESSGPHSNPMGTATPTSPVSGTPGASQNSASTNDELLQLRRRVMALTQENQALKTQLQGFKEKLDNIRKFAS